MASYPLESRNQEPSWGFLLNESHSEDIPLLGESIEEETKKSRSTTLDILVIIVSFLWATVLFILLFYFVFALPDVKQEQKFSPNFNSSVAYHDLELLSEGIGPHPSGSLKGRQAVTLFEGRIKETLAKRNNNLKVEFQVDVGSGHDRKYMTTYSNVTNLLVRLFNPNYSGEESNRKIVLLSAHWDSAIDSPGASDDGIGAVSLLQILEKFSLDEKLWEGSIHDLLIMWVGAEELGLLGSHLFVSKHPWASSIIAFLNLEASGAEGKEFLFQTGSYRIAKMYQEAVPFPNGNVMGQDAFRAKLILGGTDYEHYKNLTEFDGLDWAFCVNGYVYHTPRDRFKAIREGSILHMGANAGAMAKSMIATSQSQLQAKFGEEPSLYFDVCGWFMVVIPMQVAQIVSYVLVAISLLDLLANWFIRRDERSFLQRILWSVGALIANISSWLFSMGLCLFVSQMLDYFGKGGNRAWFGHIWIGCLLYIPMAIIGILTIQFFWQMFELRMGLNERQVFSNVYAGQLLFFAPLTVVGFAFGYGTSYLLEAWVISLTLSNFVSSWIPSKFIKSRYGMQALLYHVLSCTVAVFIIGQIAIILVLLYVPMMGKTTSGYTHLIIALLFGFGTNLVLNPIVSASRWSLKPYHFKFLVTLLLTLSIAGWITGSAMFPYTFNRPQRFTLQHKIFADAINSTHTTESYLVALPMGNRLDAQNYFGSNTSASWNANEWNTRFLTQMTPKNRGAFVFPPALDYSTLSIPTTTGIHLRLASFSLFKASPNDTFSFRITFEMPAHAITLNLELEEKIEADFIMEIDGEFNITRTSSSPSNIWHSFVQGDPESSTRHQITVYDPNQNLPRPLKLTFVSLFPLLTTPLHQLKALLPKWTAPMCAISSIQTLNVV